MTAEHTGYVDGVLIVKIRSDIGVQVPHPIHVRVCRRCGSLVLQEDEHDVWHATLDGVARQAQQSDIMLRPLGGSPF